MSITSVTKRHKITILAQSSATGASMGVGRIYAPENPPRVFDCTVFAKQPSILPQLGVRASIVPHNIYITPGDNGEEPTGIDERFRLRWEAKDEANGILSGPATPLILRITSIPRNAQGMGLYIIHAELRSEDNPLPTELG